MPIGMNILWDSIRLSVRNGPSFESIHRGNCEMKSYMGTFSVGLLSMGSTKVG